MPNAPVETNNPPGVALLENINDCLPPTTWNKALLNPNNDSVYRPSISDLYFMEQPQEFLNKDMISDEYKPINDAENNIVEPFSFRDKSIKVGREVNTKRVPKNQLLKE